MSTISYRRCFDCDEQHDTGLDALRCDHVHGSMGRWPSLHGMHWIHLHA